MQRTWRTSYLTRANWLYLSIFAGLALLPMLIKWAGINTESSMGRLLETIVLEIIVIGLPAGLFIAYGAEDKKAALKIKSLPVMDMILVGGMAFTGYGVIIFVNLVWYALLSQFGQPLTQDVPPITTGMEFWVAVAALGIVPAFCEELLFRGVLLSAYESRLKWAPAIIMVGIMFAAYHVLLLTIPAIILLGIMITFVVYRTRSIWAGVLYHFIHNFLSVCLTYMQGRLADFMDEGTLPGDLSQLGNETLVAGIVAWAVIGAFCLGLFAVFIWLLHYRTRDIVRPTAAPRKTAVIEWLPLILAGALVLCLWIAQVWQMVAV